MRVPLYLRVFGINRCRYNRVPLHLWVYGTNRCRYNRVPLHLWVYGINRCRYNRVPLYLWVYGQNNHVAIRAPILRWFVDFFLFENVVHREGNGPPFIIPLPASFLNWSNTALWKQIYLTASERLFSPLACGFEWREACLLIITLQIL